MKERLLKVLIVDDDEDDYIITSHLLSQLPFWEITTEWVSTYDQALLKIDYTHYDLFFFDYLLGNGSGLELTKYVKEKHRGPVILMTGRADEEVAIRALRKGASDYIVKENFNTDSLTRSIRYALEREQVFVDLKRNERLYKTIFNESRDILFIASLDGDIITTNQAFATIIGSDSYIGDRRLNILNILEKGFVREWDKFLKSTEAIRDKEVRFFTLSGERRIALFTAKREYHFDGHVDVHCRLHDITHLRKAEREKLFSEKLAVTGRLVRMLAHEIRNPLMNVNLAAEQLEDDLEEDDKFYTEIIKRNCTRINTLISELVRSSNPADKPLVVSDIHDTINAALAKSNDRTQLKNITVERFFEDKKLLVAQDASTLEIAFLNLIINAIEAMEPKKGLLTIRTLWTPLGVQVKITDNGCGISQEKMEHIFEPYFTGKKNGMGIGLASTMNIVQSHNGRIDLESEVGVGTVFTLTFPLVGNKKRL